MKVEIRTDEAAQFLFGEYINWIFFAVQWVVAGGPKEMSFLADE